MFALNLQAAEVMGEQHHGACIKSWTHGNRCLYFGADEEGELLGVVSVQKQMGASVPQLLLRSVLKGFKDRYGDALKQAVVSARKFRESADLVKAAYYSLPDTIAQNIFEELQHWGVDFLYCAAIGEEVHDEQSMSSPVMTGKVAKVVPEGAVRKGEPEAKRGGGWHGGLMGCLCRDQMLYDIYEEFRKRLGSNHMFMLREDIDSLTHGAMMIYHDVFNTENSGSWGRAMALEKEILLHFVGSDTFELEHFDDETLRMVDIIPKHESIIAIFLMGNTLMAFPLPPFLGMDLIMNTLLQQCWEELTILRYVIEFLAFTYKEARTKRRMSLVERLESMTGLAIG